MTVRLSLFAKILFWFFLNLVVLGVVLLVFFNLQFRFAPDSPLFTAFGHRLDFVAGLISDEMRSADRSQRDAILARYSSTYAVEFMLYTDRGERLAGPQTPLPDSVRRQLTEMPPSRAGGPRRPPMSGSPGPPPGVGGRPPGATPPPGAGLPPPDGSAPPPGGPRPERMDPGRQPPGRPAPGPQPVFTIRTTGPTRYWAGVRIPVFEADTRRPTSALLVVSSDSISGHGLFFDFKPWLLVVAVVFLLSVVLWFPFVRGLTVSIKQMTVATAQIAEERFEARVDARRSDELGRLGAAINQLGARLESFVGGQKRFLGSVSHELNSPLARVQFALSILEERVGEAEQRYVADAKEDVRVMSELVTELLAYAKAGMKTAEVRLERVALLPVVQAVVAREAETREFAVDVPDSIAVMAQPQLLSRALANVVRNAARYAGDAGPISVRAAEAGGRVTIRVADRGPGVSPEMLGRVFEPFFRLEADRGRSTGGSGLGLAIVKTCVEACEGTVSAGNLSPSGLEIAIILRAA